MPLCCGASGAEPRDGRADGQRCGDGSPVVSALAAPASSERDARSELVERGVGGVHSRVGRDRRAQAAIATSARSSACRACSRRATSVAFAVGGTRAGRLHVTGRSQATGASAGSRLGRDVARVAHARSLRRCPARWAVAAWRRRGRREASAPARYDHDKLRPSRSASAAARTGWSTQRRSHALHVRERAPARSPAKVTCRRSCRRVRRAAPAPAAESATATATATRSESPRSRTPARCSTRSARSPQ